MFLSLPTRCAIYALVGCAVFFDTVGARQCNTLPQPSPVLEQQKQEVRNSTRYATRYKKLVGYDQPLTIYHRSSRTRSNFVPIFSEHTVNLFHDLPLTKRNVDESDLEIGEQDNETSPSNERAAFNTHISLEGHGRKARSNGALTTPTSTKVIIAASGGISLLFMAGMILCLCERRTPPPNPASAKLLAGGVNVANRILQKPGSPFSEDDWSVPTIIVTSMDRDDTLIEQPSLISKRGKLPKESPVKRKIGTYEISNPIIQVPPRSVSPGRSPIRPRIVNGNSESSFPLERQCNFDSHPMRTGYGRYERSEVSPIQKAYYDVDTEYGMNSGFVVPEPPIQTPRWQHFPQPPPMEVYTQNPSPTGRPTYRQDVADEWNNRGYEADESANTRLAYLV